MKQLLLIAAFLAVPCLWAQSGQKATYRLLVDKDNGVIIYLPDQTYTPGATRTTDVKEVCSQGAKQFRKTTKKMKEEVCAEYGIPGHCWGSGATGQVAQVDTPAHNILPSGDRFEVGGVDTVGSSAQMVEFQPALDRTPQDNPKENVGTHSLESDAIHSERNSAVAARLHSLAGPDPTPGTDIFFDLSEDGFFDWPNQSMTRFTSAMAATKSLSGRPLRFEELSAIFALTQLAPSRVVLMETGPGAELFVPMSVVNKDSVASATGESKRHRLHFTTSNPSNQNEIDHLTPLTLGGADEVVNLWPQPYPQAHWKDMLEDWSHKKICAAFNSGDVETAQEDLIKVQRAIADNWYALWLDMKAVVNGNQPPHDSEGPRTSLQ